MILPVSADLVERRLGINSNADVDTFIRAVFERGALKAQMDVVAERAVIALSGEKAVAQTRCAITAADEAVWR